MPCGNKVMQVWGREAVEFMRDASAFGSYHAELAEILRPYLPKDGHVCDAGCGLGDLAVALCRYCREVTAVDISAPAIAALRERNLPENLHVVCGDIHEMQADYDAMVFCYFGRTAEILQIAKKQCRGKVIIVKRNCAEHRFSLGNVRMQYTADKTLKELDELHIPYQSREIALEFGQPFRCEADAVRFFELYNKDTLPVDEEQVLERLVPQNNPEFPLYLPSERRMELIVLEAADLKDM